MIEKGKQVRPFFALLYGAPKVGKTHLALLSENPLVIDVDRGSSHFDCARIDNVVSKQLLMEALRHAYQSEFKSIVLDSVTAVERILIKECLSANRWKTLEDPGYGKGYTALAHEWNEALTALERIRDSGKNVILIGHQKSKTVNDPTLDLYDRLEIDVTKHATTSIVSATDAVLFYRWKTRVKKEENGKRSIGVSTGVRELWTQEKAGFIAGNRYGLEVCVENPTAKLWESMK